MKYIFVTGGVVSSLGKGLAAASLGTLLELRGLRVAVPRGNSPIHSRSRRAKCRQHARHAGALHQSCARTKNEANAAKRRQVARDWFAAAGLDLPHRESTRP